MAYLEWKNSLSIGLKTIDDQHKVLIGLINDLGEAMKSGKTKDELGNVLKGLLDYTIEHFGFEEKWFNQHGYADKAAHVEKHKQFIDQIAGFKNDFESGKLLVSTQVMNYLTKWLTAHIKGTDTEYVAFMKEHGMT